MAKIDRVKCISCGTCARVCPPAKIAGFEDVGSVGDAVCLACGHCASVCPTGAASPPGFEPAAMGKKIEIPGYEQTLGMLRSRRSVRSFKPEAPTPAELEKLAEAAKYAPSSHNSQQIRFTAALGREKTAILSRMTFDYLKNLLSRLKDKQTMMEAAAEIGEKDERAARVLTLQLRFLFKAYDKGVDIFFYGAPALLVFIGEDKGVRREDAALAASYAMIAAPPLGLGTVSAGYFMAASRNWPDIREFFDIGADEAIHYALAVGYPAVDYHRLPPRKERPLKIIR